MCSKAFGFKVIDTEMINGQAKKELSEVLYNELYSLSTAGMTKLQLLDELLLRRLEDWENDE